ncbi:MAG TPA: hypothetical protein VMT85_07575 [Thermoanaerobaculia bacterium]|nr:hypothetical protein [Thermoanaerobaculia bacterium]
MPYSRTISALLVLLVLGGCETLGNLVRLSQVRFFLDRVGEARLAGIDVGRLSDPGRLDAEQVLQVAAAIRSGSVPLDLVLHVGAENPSGNSVEVERVVLDWTLFLRGRETVNGVVDRALEIAPGQTSDLPVPIELDLYRFFREDARELIELARTVVTGEGDAGALELRARPTVYTPIGPIRYPDEIVLSGERL